MPLIDHSFILRFASSALLMPLVLFCLVYGHWPFAVMMGVATVISIKEWYGLSKRSTTFARDMVLGTTYIFICLVSFGFLRIGFGAAGDFLALATILTVWASDTGAYVFGKLIKGPKMAPSISPNKTWAGLFGGMACSALALWGFAVYIGPALAYVFHQDFSFVGLNQNPVLVLVLGASFTVFGQIGDLLISHQKRRVGVKDTGALIPGHGGLLDRIDALLLVSFMFAIVLWIMGA